MTKNIFDDPDDKLEDIRRTVDGYRGKSSETGGHQDDIFSDTPMELKKTQENLGFINRIRENLPRVKKKNVSVDVFGVEKVNLDDILMMNIWDRSILTTDAVSRLVFKMTFEQMKKYLPKKTQKGFEYWWIIILVGIGVTAILLIMMFLLPKLQGVKLF